MSPEQFPISAFDLLLRELLHWGLVTQVDEAAVHKWQLVERAGLRLDEFVAESNTVSLPVERMVFFDYRCCVCGVRQMTRLHGTHFVCDVCWAKADHSTCKEVTTISPNQVA